MNGVQTSTASNLLALEGSVSDVLLPRKHWGGARLGFGKCILQLSRENESSLQGYPDSVSAIA